MKNQKHRIGIVGGMGPQAGVILQQYIIEETAAKRDQDHVQVVTFTNPQIPDRTTSLVEDDGRSMVSAIVQSIKVLQQAGVSIVVMPCITAHARIELVQEAVFPLPVVNMVDSACKLLGIDEVVGILATDGTIREKIFEKNRPDIKWVIPQASLQQKVMNLIYDVKASHGVVSGKHSNQLDSLVQEMKKQGAQKVILGCTELSVVGSQKPMEDTVDPLRSVAKNLVRSIESVQEMQV